MVEIRKEFKFEAAHYLPNVPEGHQCGRMHGHSYRVVVMLRGKVDPRMGWVTDFAEVSAAWKKLCDPFTDHRTLNDWVTNPTAEMLAAHIAGELFPVLPDLARVEVWETANSMAAWELGW